MYATCEKCDHEQHVNTEQGDIGFGLETVIEDDLTCDECGSALDPTTLRQHDKLRDYDEPDPEPDYED